MYEFIVGDIVECIPGFEGEGHLNGGAGYESGKIFTIHRITEHAGADIGSAVLWPNDRDNGIYLRAVKLHQKKVYKKRKLNL